MEDSSGGVSTKGAHMTDSDHAPAIGSPAVIGRAYQDNLSWQRTDFGNGGRSTGRDYFDGRTNGASLDLPRPSATPGATGRAIKVVGLVVALAGAAGWLWLILAFVSSVGGGILPDDPFGTRLAGVPLGSGGLVAILVGSCLATVGSWMARAVRRRVR